MRPGQGRADACVSADVCHSQFLRFVWGRSRLPVRAEDFTSKFTIQRLHAATQSPDRFLPVAHTCFFSVDLPRYSSAEVMRERLLYAITHSATIDTDFEGGNVTVAGADSDDSDDEDAAAATGTGTAGKL